MKIGLELKMARNNTDMYVPIRPQLIQIRGFSVQLSIIHHYIGIEKHGLALHQDSLRRESEYWKK